MTILTKPFGDKKPEKLAVPLVGVPQSSLPNDFQNRDPEADHVDNNGYVIHLKRRTVPTVLLLLTSLFILGLGIIGGVYIYRQYAHPRMQRIRFHGFCGVPYDSSSIDNKALVLMNNKWRDDADNDFEPSIDLFRQFSDDLLQLRDGLSNDYFNEEFELDDDEGYEKITVPDFRDGRHGRFIHDFKRNQSSIIDKDMNRCFVMPLDRDTVLPPYSLFDLIRKMYNGYYDIDTDIVKHDYRVITPAVSDMSQISDRIASECDDMKIYMLEKYVAGVYKRSVAELPQDGKFAQFSGRNIVHMNIVNIDQLNEFEKSLA